MDQKPATIETAVSSALGDRRATILIVEDSPVQAELLRRALEAAGYQVIAAGNGAEGLAMAKANHPAAVVSDINMPVMDGYAVCHAIRGDDALKNTPVILLTMLSDPLDVIHGLNAGADAYLTKPYNSPSLMARLASLLAYPQAPPPATERRKVEVRLAGATHLVDADGPRMLNLLISTYENAVLQNRELTATQQALDDLNEHLEQKVLEQTAALQDSERRYHGVFTKARDGIVLIDAETGLVADCNPEFERQSGRPLAQLKGLHIWELRPPELQERARAKFDEIKGNKGGSSYELPLQRPDGTIVPIEFMSTRLRLGELAYLHSTCRDITERVLAEQTIRDEKIFSNMLVASLPDVFFLLDSTGRFVRWNEKLQDLLGLSDAEMSRTNAVAVIHETDRPLISQKIQDAFAQGRATAEARLVTKAGPQDHVLSASRIETTQGIYLIGIGMNITERKRAQIQIQESEAKLRGIFEAVVDGIAVVDPETQAIQETNKAFREMLGYGPEEILALRIPDLYPPEAVGNVLAQFERQKKGELKTAADLPVRRKDGSVFFADVSAALALLVNKPELVGVFHDISERKRTENQLKRLNWALRALGQGNSALVHAGTEKQLFQACCDSIADAEGYPLAWIGLTRDDAAHSIDIVASAGEARKYLEDFVVSWADEPRGQGPTGAAIRSNAMQVNNNLAESATYAPWIENAHSNRLASCIALPIRINGAAIGTLTVYGRERDVFGQAEVTLFEEFAADIGYGIASRRTLVAYEAGLVQREQATLKLRAAFESLIAVLAATVERRDPYTAGHQRRVAELSLAIAHALGLDPTRTEGLHFAATIHDIGKIYVPAEILARPGKLLPLEFEMIKEHAQVGFELVKDVEFPWSVADMIRQHHERLDGSGYPQGLKGDQILLEARILAVADIVEAMSSHRPYRAGLGLDAALAQIRQEAGTKLDANVVDACERVFREQGFSFSKQ